MDSKELTKKCKDTLPLVRQARAALLAIGEELGDTAEHANNAELYGAVAELRETLRAPSMLLVREQGRIAEASRNKRALNAAYADGQERARLSLVESERSAA